VNDMPKTETIQATVRQRIVRVETIEESKRIQLNDIITITAAAKLFDGYDLSTISKWIGDKLPEVSLTGSRRRYTLRSACQARKAYLRKARRQGLCL
ncbi:MAG: hypothetical protein M1546_22000, partial [Chloroflexi bacterium]|nr:hypothetical protein [Chloroflexota bacterium]